MAGSKHVSMTDSGVDNLQYGLVGNSVCVGETRYFSLERNLEF